MLLLELTDTVHVNGVPFTFQIGVTAERMPTAWVESMQALLATVAEASTREPPSTTNIAETTYADRAADTLARMTSNVEWVRVYSSPQLSVSAKVAT